MHSAVKNAFVDYRQNADAVLKLCPDGQPSAVGGEQQQSQTREELVRRSQRYKAIFDMAQRSESAQAGLDHNFVIANIEIATAVLRDQSRFYKPAEIAAAHAIIRKACEILSAVFHPSKVYFLEPQVQIYTTVETLKTSCQNEAGNIFHQFHASVLPDLLKEQPDFIGVSLGDYSQLVPGLTLTMLLKKAIKESGSTNRPHICIGGNLFGRYTDVLINNPEFFEIFTDSVIVNEGEKPVLALMEYLAGKVSIETVPNLIYVNNKNEVVLNGEEPPLPVDTLGTPDFSHLTAKDYFLPDMIFNIQASRSCYWRKCSFCTHHFGSRFAIKGAEKTVREIMELQEKHQAFFFHFIDEAISPGYLAQLSHLILENGLKLNFFIYGRLEKSFDRSLFRLAHQAGLRMVLWGFESASERIYRLMNKGELVDKNARLRIFQDAYAEGVWNFLFVMFGFPTESLAEAKETVDFLAENRTILSHGTGSTFMLLEGSPIFSDLSKYSITKVQRIRNGFSFAHQFQAGRGMSVAEKKELQTHKIEQWRLKKLQYRESSFREKLFLYVCKYGIEEVSKMHERVWL
jgi:radical SAM superfamily enzyme YgiQ (UPF0313 family)